MKENFSVYPSNKNGIHSEDSYIVVRGTTSYLRIYGKHPEWELVTATASEDSGPIKVCKEQDRLISAAMLLGQEFGSSPKIQEDSYGRKFVQIGAFFKTEGQNPGDLDRACSVVCSKFFEIYDGFLEGNSSARGEMQEMYDNLSIDDSGDDVYLSDGVWLKSDGSLDDRGR